MTNPAPLVRPNIVIASHDNAIVSLAVGDPTVEDIRAMHAHQSTIAAWRAKGEPLYSLAIIGAGARAPSAEVRAELAKHAPNAPRAQAVILEHAGIATAVLRTVLATVQFLSPKAMRIDAFRDCESGYLWLLTRASADNARLPPWESVLATIDAVRKLSRR